MNSNQINGFSLSRLNGLTWDDILGYAAETIRENGSVYYRGEFLSTMYNDEDGGGVLDAAGISMSDEQVQARIAEIDGGVQ